MKNICVVRAAVGAFTHRLGSAQGTTWPHFPSYRRSTCTYVTVTSGGLHHKIQGSRHLFVGPKVASKCFDIQPEAGWVSEHFESTIGPISTLTPVCDPPSEESDPQPPRFPVC